MRVHMWINLHREMSIWLIRTRTLRVRENISSSKMLHSYEMKSIYLGKIFLLQLVSYCKISQDFHFLFTFIVLKDQHTFSLINKSIREFILLGVVDCLDDD